MDDKSSGPILCFGEVLLRLAAPLGGRLANASGFAGYVGGSEANVGSVLAQLGHYVEMITALPRFGLGDLCEGELRRTGIRTGNVHRADGRLGLYFHEPVPGAGRIIYDRGHSVFAENADRFDWSALASTARWFHVSGINLALGGKPAEAALAAAEAMLAAGVPISFDVNHRTSLWEGRSAEEVDRVKTLVGMATLLFASPQDISRVLGKNFSDDRPEATEAAFATFERLETIASTRRSTDGDGQRLSARVDQRASSHETEPARLGQAIDRIGSGDAFAGAVIDGLLRKFAPEECAKQGLAAAVMKHAMAGDRWIGTRAELQEFDPFDAGDVRR
jgi:2-dehydro-3-deoxygluconokinase